MTAKKLVGPATLVWMLPVIVGALLAAALGFRAGWWIGLRLIEPLALFAGFAGLFVGVQLWVWVLGLAWRRRCEYLRTAGTKTPGVVVDVGYRRDTGRHLLFTDTHRVHIETEFTHPETAAVLRIRKEYRFPHWRKSKADTLFGRFPVGAAMPMLVRGNYAAFDIPDRPVWPDIW
ncbi:hypothetical protein JMUB6875_52890 [Nocardia sp. JMUB6875]|uniref:hypothetical protein n=1 Tax=Nocardia sp. JMUB6875 TaxID=3158170 RepID=UPI0032E593CD